MLIIGKELMTDIKANCYFKQLITRMC